MNVHKQIGIPGNLPRGNSDPTQSDILTPLVPRMLIFAGIIHFIAMGVWLYDERFEFSALGWTLRFIFGVGLVSVGWFFTRITSFPPNIETIAFKIDGLVPFEDMASFLGSMKKSIGVGDAILSGGEFVDRLFVRISDEDHREFTRSMAESGIEATRLNANDKILQGNAPTVRVPAFDT